MKIGLIDVDGHNFPNIPLAKISAWHKAMGDTVEWYYSKISGDMDIVYMSKVFTFTPDYPYFIDADMVVKGGTGYPGENRFVELNNEIEHIYPDYSIHHYKYPATKTTAYGFLTRGCPNNCGFCIVSQKEGFCSRQVADLDSFWRGQRNINLLDPNLLANAGAEKLLSHLAESRAYINFSQGLDIRLLDKHRADLIKTMRISIIHFAWDNPKQDLIHQFELVKKWLGYNARKLAAYVLTNYNSTHDEDLYRVETLRNLGFDPYVMVYEKETAPQITNDLQRYVNNKRIFKSCQFEDYDPKIG